VPGSNVGTTREKPANGSCRGRPAQTPSRRSMNSAATRSASPARRPLEHETEMGETASGHRMIGAKTVRARQHVVPARSLTAAL